MEAFAEHCELEGTEVLGLIDDEMIVSRHGLRLARRPAAELLQIDEEHGVILDVDRSRCILIFDLRSVDRPDVFANLLVKLSVKRSSN